jgi:hypothetical protein
MRLPKVEDSSNQRKGIFLDRRRESDSRTTSVGTRALLRFFRPVCYQDTTDTLLPLELRQANPLNIMRMVNGKLT